MKKKIKTRTKRCRDLTHLYRHYFLINYKSKRISQTFRHAKKKNGRAAKDEKHTQIIICFEKRKPVYKLEFRWFPSLEKIEKYNFFFFFVAHRCELKFTDSDSPLILIIKFLFGLFSQKGPR